MNRMNQEVFTYVQFSMLGKTQPILYLPYLKFIYGLLKITLVFPQSLTIFKKQIYVSPFRFDRKFCEVWFVFMIFSRQTLLVKRSEVKTQKHLSKVVEWHLGPTSLDGFWVGFLYVFLVEKRGASCVGVWIFHFGGTCASVVLEAACHMRWPFSGDDFWDLNYQRTKHHLNRNAAGLA